jgi:predicted ATPase/class 3 adenylate cyclase/DNA-binding CsgD family transcriptional regulator
MSGSDPRAATWDWSDLGVSELPTGTVTLLLADVEGSTRLWETRPDEMADAVARLDRALTDLVASHSGVRPVEQGEGDSFVVAFARASDAVACALGLQRAPLAPILLRIGLHTGEVRLRDQGNYIGPAINRTARLRDLAHGGQTVLSGVTEELVFEQLPADAWLTNLGIHRLRDVARPERIAQLCHSDIRNDFPPLRAAQNTDVRGLPVQLTTFVGRAVQMADVRALLAANRLVTLTGAGGAGKTRLAVELTARIVADFSDGAWYVDLAPVTHTDVVPVAIARALGLPDQPGRSTVDTLRRFVGERHMLLVLDNCEHLLAATAELSAALLGDCPGLTMMTTSREPLGVHGEVTFVVPSLSLANEAIALFRDRARRVRPEFGISAENIETVTEICRRLDGMPLAIELAAARVRALSLDEILGSLHDRFLLLTGGARTAVRRQQTLRASVDWSHALLTETERVLFRRLAVFLGGFDLHAARAIAGDAEVQHHQILDQLALLVDKSLVVAENSGGRTRYRLLETVRQYAQEKLGESGEAATIRVRHRDHYTGAAALLDAPARGAYQERVNQADADMDNLRSAFAWSVETGDIASALGLASSLQPLWLSRGRIQEGLAWFDAALADGRDADVDPSVRARGISDRVVLKAWVNVYSQHEAEQALTIARQLDDPPLLLRALIACGSAAVYDTEVARRYFAEALGLARDLGDQWRLSQILAQQAQVALVAGDIRELREAAEEGCEVAEAIGDRFGLLQCRWRLASAYVTGGDLREGVAELRRSVIEAEADHDVISQVTGLLMLPHALAYLGEVSEARAAAETAIRSAVELGDVYLGASYIGLMIAHLAAGDVTAAEKAADAAWSHLGGLYGTASINNAYLAQAAFARGDMTGARSRAEEAIAGTSGWPVAVALTARAWVEVAEGDYQQAECDGHQALACRAEVGANLDVPGVLEVLGNVSAKSGRHLEAARLLGAADAIRLRTGEVRFAIYQDQYQATLAATRNALKDSEFDAAWAEGAALTTEEVIAYLRRGRGERKRPATGWDSLTPTELDVVRLVGEGLANKDIANRLFVSPRTVESHLTHAYTKLGFTSRVQLAQEASRRGA